MVADPLIRYTQTASRSASIVIARYSTSFGLACRFLGSATRADVENIYALVRVADEAVDGAAAAAGLGPNAVGEQLDRLERETESALATGFSTNMVVHAFAGTARRAGITSELTRPFFASMRADLTTATHSDESLQEYIYGSAEVVGLMCLRVFQTMPGARTCHEAELTAGARRLGAAFQKVNFLRDLAADSQDLGRSYFAAPSPVAARGPEPVRQHEYGSGAQVLALTEERKRDLVADIRADLAAAGGAVVLLPPRARLAVELARSLFEALAARLEKTPAAELAIRRVRVPGTQKAAIAVRVLTVHCLQVPAQRTAARRARR